MIELDTSGLICPLPVLRARKALRDMDPGAILEVRATDPASVRDFPAFCDAAGYTLIDAEVRGDIFIFRIAKEK